MKINIKLLIIFISAFLIRLIAINQSLWLDEATTARVVQQYSYSEILNKFSPSDFHPPLYYLIMKVWTNVFGYSEIALRMPSVVFSLLTGYLVYLLGKQIKNIEVGLLSAALFLFNPLIIYYSQEARMYMMIVFFLTGSIYFLSRINQLELVSRKGKFDMVGALLLFSIFIILALATFYGSIFMIISLFFYLIYKKRFRLLFLLLFCVTATILLLSPLFFHQLLNARNQLNLVPNWKSVLGSANLKNLLLIPMKFSIGRISFEPKWLYWGISAIWTFVIWFIALRAGLKNKFFLFLLLAPLGLGLFFSFFSPLLQYFRFLYLLPILCMLLAMGSAKFHRSGGIWLVLTGFIIWSFAYLLNSQFHREDWKSLVNSLPKNSRVYMIVSSSDPVKYYRNDLEIVDLRKIDQIKENEIYVLPYTADIHGVNYRNNLTDQKFKLSQEVVYRMLILEKWKK